MAKRQGVSEVTHLWELYEQGLEYQTGIGLSEQIKQNIKYFEGKQWPSPTESTKNLPRPVINIVKMICRSKKASILSSPLSIVYKTYTQGTDISKFNSFASELFKEMGQELLDRMAIDSGVKKGSYFYHYYWDKDAVSVTGKRDGSVRCEIIEPTSIFFSTPAQLDEQKQDYILISSTRDISSLCAAYGLSKDAFKEDAEDGSDVVLLTRYFRIGGEVYFEQGTKTKILVEPTPLCPSHLLENTENQTQVAQIVKAHLYPVVCGYYEKREGSIYGLSEIEGLIPNQKAINFNIAMSLLNAQECAWGKYIALPNALKGQKISNVPGQVLIDHTGTGNGIKRLSGSSVLEKPLNMSSTLIDITRSISGASELMSGEISAGLSGTAIAQLQSQALLPIEDLRNEFVQVKRKQGLVLAQFMRLYFFDKEFITLKDSGEEYFDVFNSSDFENSIFDVRVEVSNSQKATVASDISLLDTCLSSGQISLKTYIRAYPDCAISNKAELLELIEQEESQKTYTDKKEEL